MLLIIGAIAAGAMYPVVAPLDTADPSKPQHFGLTVMTVVHWSAGMRARSCLA